MRTRNREKINLDNVEASVLELLSGNLDVPKDNISPASLLVGDLGMDSFAAVELMFELEERTGIEIPDQDVRGFQKVSDIVEYIQKHMQISQN
jgi:acyl carrier protein